MHAGTITWNGVDLSGIGKPKLTISQQADPPSPAQPTRRLVSLKVTVVKNSATARAWVQGKRVLVDGIGTAGVTRHETEQPKESENTEHAPFSGTDVTTRTFTGSYGWTFTGTALDGLWGG